MHRYVQGTFPKHNPLGLAVQDHFLESGLQPFRKDLIIYNSKTSLNRSTIGPTISGPFSEVAGLGS